MLQNEGPVELPNHVLVGTSRYGERRPPCTLPNSSRTGVGGLPETRIGSAWGGAIPKRTHQSRLRSAASKKMLLGKRLRGPSLHDPGGTARPALTMSAGAAEYNSSSGVACAAPAIS